MRSTRGRLRPNRAPSSSAQSTSRTVRGGVPSAARRRSTASPPRTFRQPSSHPPSGTESRCPPIRTAAGEAPASVTHTLPASSTSRDTGRSASKDANHRRASAQPSVQARRCAPRSSPVSARSSLNSRTVRAGSSEPWPSPCKSGDDVASVRLHETVLLRGQEVEVHLGGASGLQRTQALDVTSDAAKQAEAVARLVVHEVTV